MKKIIKYLLILLLTTTYTNIQSQDNKNVWQFTFGLNAVDLEADTSTQFNDFFAVDENWNVSSGISTFTLSKYLIDNLSVGLTTSVNTISKQVEEYERPNDAKYFAFDVMLKYSLNIEIDFGNGDVFKMNKIEPYVGVGLGNTWMFDEDWLTINGSLGTNYWVTETFGLTAQVDYKHNMSDSGRGASVMLDEGGTMRYSVGLSIKFDGQKN